MAQHWLVFQRIWLPSIQMMALTPVLGTLTSSSGQANMVEIQQDICIHKRSKLNTKETIFKSFERRITVLKC